VRQKANAQVCECGEPGTGGAGTQGGEVKAQGETVFLAGFPALVPCLEGSESLDVETEQGCILFSTSPVKTCYTGICLSARVLHSIGSFTVSWVISGILGFMTVF